MTELETAIEAGDVERTLAALETMPEVERRAAAPVLAGLHAKVHREEPFSARHTAATLALFGTGTLAQAMKCGYDGDPAIARVLLARRPAWLQEWCDAVADRRWPLVRRLARAGAVERRSSERYTIGLISQSTLVHPVALFEEQPELLETELWDLFVYEGNGENSLSSADKYAKGGRGWSGALSILEARGTVSRARLLDASLDALERDFPQFRAGWFSRFHESLAPTLNERAARAERYVRLLNSRVPPTVTFALGMLASLEAAGRPLPVATLRALTTAYSAKAKSTALDALKLGAVLLEREPEPARRASAAAFAVALEHPEREVQSAALDVLERHAERADPALRDRLASVANLVVPSLRERFRAAFASPDAAPVPALPREEVAAAPFERARIAPIVDVDELVEAYAAVLESEAAPEDLERVLDGVSRLCAERPADFERVTGPLRKRAERILDPKQDFKFAPLRRVFAALACAWLSGEYAPPTRLPDDPVPAFLFRRVDEAGARIARGRAAPLLAAPTHRGCTIEPLRLVERFAASDGSERYDAIAALLRLSYGGRADARPVARGLAGEAGAALRYALGDGGCAAGSDTALWIAASRARVPRAYDPLIDAAFPGFGPDAAQPAVPDMTWDVRESTVTDPRTGRARTYRFCSTRFSLTPPLPAGVPADLPTVNRWRAAARGSAYEASPELLRWCGSIRPLERDAWFAEGCVRVGGNLDWHSAQWANRTYFEPLLESDVPVGTAGALLLSLGLLAKDATEGVLAVDGLGVALADGRLDASALEKIVANVVAWRANTITKRAAPRLALLARTSSRHAQLVRAALRNALPADGAGASELRPLRELLRELSVE
jgi:hypothetical protein